MIGSRFKPGAVSKLKTILRFEEQNLNWSLNDYTQQTNAFAYGLKEAKIAPNAKALVWLDDKHTTELATVLMGCLKAGVNAVSMDSAVLSLGTDAKSQAEVLVRENPDLIIVSPNQKFESKKKIEWLYEVLPQLEKSNSHKKLSLSGLPNLSHVVQTGFYEKKGTIKFRDFLLYRDRNLSNHETLDFKQNYETALAEGEDILKDINERDQVYFVGDFNNFPAIRKLMLGSSLSGYFMHMLSRDALKRSDLKFINDMDESVRCHIVADSTGEQQLRERVSRGNVNYIKL